jgi:hypothetical protein
MYGPSGPNLTNSRALRDRMMLSNVNVASFHRRDGGGNSLNQDFMWTASR